MTIIHAFILGIVEGVTEFLPVSSTFHLIIAGRLMGIGQTEFMKLFEVVIQSGAIVAVFFISGLAVFRRPTIIRSLAISFFPTMILGLILHSFIKDTLFRAALVQCIAFIGVGAVFIVLERKGFGKQAFGMDELRPGTAFLVGIAQAIAVIPGVSRSGAVIVALLFAGMKRRDAALYSFLLAVPTILAASALDVWKARSVMSQFPSDAAGLLGIGWITSFVSAYVVMRWFIGYLSTRTLAPFGWYRIVIGSLLVVGIMKGVSL